MWSHVADKVVMEPALGREGRLGVRWVQEKGAPSIRDVFRMVPWRKSWMEG